MPNITDRYGKVLGRYNDFSGGEYGALGGRRAQTGQFTGLNVVAYLDGSIGPRAGVKPSQPRPHIEVIDVMPSTIFAIGRERGGDGNLWVVDVDGKAWKADYPQPTIPTNWFVYTGTFALSDGTSSVIDTVDDSTDTYLTSFNEEAYRIDHEAFTVTALPGSPGGRCIARYGEHLVIGCIPGGGPNMLRWSAPNDYESWPALNFLRLGSNGDIIKSLRVQHNVLVVTMEHGDIHTVSGALGASDSTRQLTADAPREALLNGQRVALTKSGRALWRRGNNAVPESFDGAQLRAITYLNNWLRASEAGTDIAICQGRDDDDILIFGSYGALLQLHNGAWTRHALGIRGLDPENPPVTFAGIYVAYDGHDHVLIATNLMDDLIPALYTVDLGLDRPPVGSLGDTVEDEGSGEAPLAGFTTTELRDSAGRLMSPRGVLVRFTKYATGSAQTNHFDVQLHRHDVWESEEPAPPDVQTFDEDPTEATESGVREARFYGFEAGQDCGGVSVTIGFMRGVKIDELVVYGEIEPSRA